MRQAHLLAVVAGFAALLVLGAAGVTPAGAGNSFTIIGQSSLIVGQSGKVVRITAAPAGTSVPVARACYDIDSSLFVLPPMDLTEAPSSGDICSGSTPVASVPEGDYTVTGGVYEPGSDTPEKEVQLLLTVHGTRFATLNGRGLSADPAGDANCDGQLDGADIAGVLRRVAEAPPYPSCIESGNVVCGDPIGPADALAMARRLAGIAQTLAPCPELLDAPALLSPPDGSVFDHFPRDTDVSWAAVPGAGGYVVYVDREGCEPYTDWCSALGWGASFGYTTDTSWTFSATGRGPGRWRVQAIDAAGRPGPLSEWRGFAYTV